ncbi:MAG: PglZ domain-containing protein, partial [Promethearchaeota archaeon]
LEKLIFNVLLKINSLFTEYLIRNYENWVSNIDNKSTPLNVVNGLKRLYFKNQLSGLNTFNLFLFIDCCHLEIWNILKQKILKDFSNLKIETKIAYSILPTITNYARMALFSGNYPINFQSDNELKEFFRNAGKPTTLAYIEKMKNNFITNCENMFDFKKNINNIKKNKDNFQISIFNFSDKTSHTYSQNFLKTLINSIYNSKIRPLLELITRKYKDYFIFFATDHWCSRCTEIFDWENQKFNRYWDNDIFHKRGARAFISYEIPSNFDNLAKKLICIKYTDAKKWGLPSQIKLPKSSLIMDVSYFFAVNYYNLKKTPENKRNLENFGHGGASMDEMIIPFAIIKRKTEDYKEFNWDLDVEFSIEDGNKNTHIYKIVIRNNSNKDIFFDKGHIITEKLHYKFVLYNNYKISNASGKNVRRIKFRFMNKYFPTKASFNFTFFQDEKLESSQVYYT